MELHETPVLKSTGLPREWDSWSEAKRKSYLSARAFDGPPGYSPPEEDD